MYKVRKSLDKFLENSNARGSDIRAVTCYKNNKLLFNFAVPPHSVNDKQQVYSLSKSFTSTAVGMAVGEGLLKVTDRIADIFRDEIKYEISDHAGALTVRDCLTMRTGHSSCAMGDIINGGGNALGTFLTKPFNYKPGTHFVYNTGSTYILSAVITKLTGETLYDYLTPRLFEPLGIYNALWRAFQGVTEGGYGLHISCFDAAQLGVLYLNKGNYNGVQLLSPEWVSEAVMPWADNSAAAAGAADWGAGYGYQFWRNHRGGYRGDGAFGQYCLIDDENKLVLAVFSETPHMQKGMDCIYELIQDIKGEDGEYTEYKPEPKPAPLDLDTYPSTQYNDKWLNVSPNKYGITKLKYTLDTDEFTMRMSDSASEQTIVCGIGEWICNELIMPYIKPAIPALSVPRPESVQLAACFTGGAIIYRHLNNPHMRRVKVTFTENGATFKCGADGEEDEITAYFK